MQALNVNNWGRYAPIANGSGSGPPVTCANSLPFPPCAPRSTSGYFSVRLGD